MKKSLKKLSGLPATLVKNKVEFGPNSCRPQFEIKKYSDHRQFFQNNNLDKNQDLYYIYRTSCLKKDGPLFSKRGLRYDITAITPGLIGNEPHHTIGHIHKKLSKGAPSEIYQVVYGRAIFLIQNNKTKKFYAIYRNAGQKIIIPPDCGHITVNASIKNPLVVANIFINKTNASDYSFFRKNQGPAWYPVWKNNKIDFEKNKSQKNQFSFKKISTYKKIPFRMSKSTPLYRDFLNGPDKFYFLTDTKKLGSKLSDSSLF